LHAAEQQQLMLQRHYQELEQHEQDEPQQEQHAVQLHQSHFPDDSHVSDGETQPLPVVIQAITQDAASDREYSDDSASDYDVSCSEDFDLFNLSVDKTKTSDYEISRHWGIDPGECSLDGTLADTNEPPLQLGEAVFVLQLEWGDDSLGRLRNRLEARVLEFSERFPDLVHVK
jgi:hypothetical protein